MSEQLLPVYCTCERAIVAGTATQIWDGTPISCGKPDCPGIPSRTRTPRPKRKQAACGTQSGWYRHRRLGETPCGDCVSALRAYQAEATRRHRAKGVA